MCASDSCAESRWQRIGSSRLRAEYPTNVPAKSACRYRSTRRARISPDRARSTRQFAAESSSVRLPVFFDQSRNAFSAASRQDQHRVRRCPANCEYGLPVAGSTLSRYRPLTGSTNRPSMKFRIWNGSARMVGRKVKASSSNIERSNRKNCSGQAV